MLADFQMSYRGLVFGKGTPYRLVNVAGLEALQVRTGDLAIPRGHGDLRGLDTVAPRDIRMTLIVRGAAGSAQFAADKAAALRAFRHSRSEDFRLSFKDPETPEKFIWCRVVDREVPKTIDSAFGYQPIQLRLRAVDPRLYSATVQTHNLSVYSASGGGTDIEDFPMEFDPDEAASTIVNNAGDADAYPLIRFYGPNSGTVEGVAVTNVTTGRFVHFSTDILVNQILEADMRRIVTASTGPTPLINLDGSNRYGDWVIPRIPLALVPGDNALRFEVNGTSTDAQCVVTFRNTWL